MKWYRNRDLHKRMTRNGSYRDEGINNFYPNIFEKENKNNAILHL